MIQQSVMAEAGAQAQKLQDQAREFKETAMKKAEEEVLQELYSRIQDEITEIHTSATRSVSQKETKERQDLLLRREEITRAVRELFRAQGVEPYVLSTESCALCEECTYPDAPCRHPDRMFPCVESQGILVTELSERHGIGFWAEGNIVTWFSLLLFDEEAS